MPATTNPFPGMNPFFQENWGNVHLRLISYIADSLAEDLPPDLTALAEERVALSEDGEKKREYRADTAIVESWGGGMPLPSVGFPADGGAALAVAKPLLFRATTKTERWVEIRTAGGDLITVIEVLSPTNKRGSGYRAYRERQWDFQAAGVHLVEIDLIRGGDHTVSVDAESLRPEYPPGTCHVVCTTRVLGGDDLLRWEVYLCPLRQALPTIRVPLRQGEPDVALAIQPLVDRCYRTGRYWLSPTDARKLHPPMADEEEIAWIEERLREAGSK